jgi:DNA topoisomerase-1
MEAGESVQAEAAAAARTARLRYVSDRNPGITRHRRGASFGYRGPDGRPIRDADTLARIRRLAVPPAWEEVWISPDPNGHVQAVGRDARGRKQYRYHPRWRSVRDEAKFDRLAAFAEKLPEIRARVAADLGRPGMPRAKVLAAVVRLLETTLIRVGNDEYARSNESFGLTTLRNRHARVNGRKVESSIGSTSRTSGLPGSCASAGRSRGRTFSPTSTRAGRRATWGRRTSTSTCAKSPERT